MKTTKIICISEFHDQLELHKIYNGRAEFSANLGLTGWYIEWHKNQFLWYPNRCFITLAEWRNQQIDSILND